MVTMLFLKIELKNMEKRGNKASNFTLKGIQEGMEGFKEIRVLGKEGYFYRMVNNGVKKQALYSSKYQFLATIPRSLIELLMIAFIVSLVIAANSVYACTEHTQELVDGYFAELDPIFATIKECEEGLDVNTLLEGPLCHSGFKRLN
jgi:hypothetical protein